MMSSLRSSFRRLLSQTKHLTSLVNRGHHEQALLFFSQMFSSPDLTLDPFAFPLALKSSAALRLPNAVASIHAHATKAGLLPNPFVASSLVDSHGKCAGIAHARQAFDESPQRNVVVWNAMIALYSRSSDTPSALEIFEVMDVQPNASSYNSIVAALSESEDDGPYRALHFYRRMRASGLAPNLITVLALLPICVRLGALSFIKEIHGFAVRGRIYPHPQLGSGFIETYGRCGCLVYARRIFDLMKDKDVVVWSSLVSAYAFHGNADIAMSVFRWMETEKVQPDGIMFLGILKACSHSGFADDALKYFDIMTDKYGVEASSDHYSCLVDVLSRAGRLKEAYEVLDRMPVKATAKAWGALLGACRSHGEVRLAEIAGRVLFELEPENAGNYVLLAEAHTRRREV
ncbi:uncharacterized protein A4U43_C07F39400 [Asparagus officinalis]|uniref:Pentacotripeptide-repeat region of PRORP domain-containing protein n=1 Tax=Asparagus officinalis TaxID=4686 RepID=A0A5P1EIU3_ASPOF|nr:uncharacterized protein A4U43_C07F39400 [Asparagus officinalis]